jgi:hypothetical protein
MSLQEGAQVGNAFMNMGRTAMMFGRYHDIQQDRALKLEDRKTNEEAYELAGLLAANQQTGDEPGGGMQQVEGRMPGVTGMSNAAVNMPATPKLDLSKYSPEVQFKGRKLFQLEQKRKFETKRDEYDLSDMGRSERASIAAQKTLINNKNINTYLTLKKSNAPLIQQINAAADVVTSMANGTTVKVIPGENGALHKVEITGWDNKSEIVELTEDKISELQSQAEALVNAQAKLPMEDQMMLQGKHALMIRNANTKETDDALDDENIENQYKGKDDKIYARVGNFRDPKTHQFIGQVYTTGDPNDPLIPVDSEEVKALGLTPMRDVLRKTTGEKTTLERKKMEADTAYKEKQTEALGEEKKLTLVQRQKQVDISIKEQLANKLLNDQSIKDAIYNGTVTAANVLKDPSAHLSPAKFELHQKTKALALKYSKDMPIPEAIQKAETEAQASTGDDLVSKFVAIKNPEERKTFAQNLKESDPELFAFFQEASKRYDIKKEKKTMKDKNYPSTWKGSSIKMRP